MLYYQLKTLSLVIALHCGQLVCMLLIQVYPRYMHTVDSGAAVTAARLRVDQLPVGVTWDLGRRRLTR
jgi:hypothetical protein